MNGTRVSFSDLLDWVEGRLSPDRAAQIAALVEADVRLQDNAEWIRRFLATAREAPLVEVPESLRYALRDAFRRRHAGACERQAPTRLVLLFDSRHDHELTGVRSIDAGTGVHLAYTAYAADLVLDVHYLSDTTARIAGQVLPRDQGSAVTDLVIRTADGAAQNLSGDDPLGRFVVVEVPAGPMQLCARTGGVDIVADFDLSQDAS